MEVCVILQNATFLQWKRVLTDMQSREGKEGEWKVRDSEVDRSRDGV